MKKVVIIFTLLVALVAGMLFILPWDGFITNISDEDRNVSELTGSVTIRHQDNYDVEVSSLLPSIIIKVSLDDLPLDGCIFTCFHAMLLPEDYSTIYHGHPHWMRKGELVLPLPGLKNGPYEMWLEATVSSGHDDVPFLQKFSIDVKGNNVSQIENKTSRLDIEPVNIEIGEINQISHLKFLIKLDDKPVKNFGEYVGVAIHAFVMKEDGSYFRHDHAEPEGDGIVDAHFAFPNQGRYFLFLQPTVKTKTGDLVRETMRYPIVIK